MQELPYTLRRRPLACLRVKRTGLQQVQVFHDKERQAVRLGMQPLRKPCSACALRQFACVAGSEQFANRLLV